MKTDPNWRRNMVEKLGLDETLLGMVSGVVAPSSGADRELAHVYVDLYVAKQLERTAGALQDASEYLGKALEDSSRRLIMSNQVVADSNRRYALAFNILAAALVALGIVGLYLRYH